MLRTLKDKEQSDPVKPSIIAGNKRTSKQAKAGGSPLMKAPKVDEQKEELKVTTTGKPSD